jgi:GT2 family glycosyltransferase
MKFGNHPRVATIVLNYDNADDTVIAVDSLRLSECLDQRVIVVDNNPDSAAQSALKSRLGNGIDYLATGSNLGYAAGNNRGIRLAQESNPEFIWILSPDVLVEPETLTGLLAAASDASDAGVVGARLLDANSDGQSPLFDGAGIVDVDYVTGACMLLRSRAIAQVGLISEGTIRHFAETDYVKRMQNAGWRTVVAQAVALSQTHSKVKPR